jgi:hypothetical protein
MRILLNVIQHLALLGGDAAPRTFEAGGRPLYAYIGVRLPARPLDIVCGCVQVQRSLAL